MRCNRWLALAAASAWMLMGSAALAQQAGTGNNQLPDLPSETQTEAGVEAEADVEADVDANLEAGEPRTGAQLESDAAGQLETQQNATQQPNATTTEQDPRQDANRARDDRPLDRAREAGRELGNEGREQTRQANRFLGEQVGLFVGDADGNLTISALPVDSLAADAGLRQGDQIISINGQAFATQQEINTYLADFPGDTLAIEVDRGGQRQTIDLDVSQVNWTEPMDAPALASDANRPALGITLTEDRGDLFIRDIAPNSPAVAAGLLPGDHLLSLNGQRFSTTGDFIAAVAEMQAGEQIELVIGRDREAYVVTPTLAGWSDVYASSHLANNPPAPPQGRMVMRPDFDGRTMNGDLGNLQREVEQLREEVHRLRQEVHRLNGTPAPGETNPETTTPPQPGLE